MSKESAAILAAIVLLALWQFGTIQWAWRRFVVRPVVSIWRKPSKQDRPGIPAGTRFKILKRDKFRCVYCGKGVKDGRKLHIDHYVPWSKTKTHDPNQLVVACNVCNLGKSDEVMAQPIEDFVR